MPPSSSFLGFWFHSVMELHTHRAPPSLSFFSPPISALGFGGENSNCERATYQDQNHTTQRCCCPATNGPGTVPGDSAKDFTGWRVEMTGLAPKPSTAPLCASVSSCVPPHREAWKVPASPFRLCSWVSVWRCQLPTPNYY